MTTIVTNQPVPPGGDGIGLSLTIEHDHLDDTDSNPKPAAGNDQQVGTGGMVSGGPTMKNITSTASSFIPISVDASPIAFEKQACDEDDEGSFTIHHIAELDDPPTVPSIMRQPSSAEKEPDEKKNQCAPMQPYDGSHVAALEDRVRDLEEKLSTLSMLLLQQNQKQQQQSPRSISPPTTPFRSIDTSLATIPSSNVPVLESPTPNFDSFDISQPYEERRHRNQTRNGLANFKLRNNLSYHILHAPDLELNRRSSDDDGSNLGDGGENQVSNLNASDGSGVGGTLHSIHHDEEYEKSTRVPSLDSLPGSSRTSPIQSQNPVVAKVLSSENFLSIDAAKKNAKYSKDNSDFVGRDSLEIDTAIMDKDHKENSGKSASTTVIARTRMNSISSNANGSVCTSDTPKHQKKKSNIKSKWLDYLNSVQESNYDTDKQMEEFVKVPKAVEALLGFGFWISVDSFLYTLTMLPIRFAYSIALLLVWVYRKIAGRPAGSFQFHRHNSYHVIQVSIIYIIYKFVLKPINISILYHWIRSQSMVKLYLVVAIVEVFDRLMCSLGQDCLDSLYWNTTRRPRSSRLLVSALVVLVYTALHSFLLFVHVATLNVAMNSDDQALLSLLIGGNFAEIKSTVFKKYNKASLFKIAASDICERFKLFLFLILVLMLNASQGMDQKMLYNYLSMCGIIWCAEWLSDWLKHSFITKFNYIASSVYSEYSLLLAGDVSGFGHEGENLDKSHAVVKRLGLAQIPLVCVMTKYLKEAYKYQTYQNQPQTWVLFVGVFSIWLVLLVCKLSLATFLQRLSKIKLEAAPDYSKNNATVAKKNN